VADHDNELNSRCDVNNAPRVTIVVLNWNGRDDTLDCLGSLVSLEYPNHETIVVDNGSHDGSVAAVKDRFPQLEVVETGKNLGYAEGNNVGIRIALERGADYVLLLNNDTIVDSRMLEVLIAAAEQCPEGGFFGPTILRHGEGARIWSAGVRWHEAEMEFRHVEEDATGLADARGVAVTDYVCGCALLVRTSVLRRIGLLDPSFFLTFEESDLCYRGRRVGIASYIAPRARIWHKISASFGGANSPLMDYFLVRNRLLWGERHLDRKRLKRLYKSTWWDVYRELIGNNRSKTGNDLRKVKNSALHVAAAWKNPRTKAIVWGVAHYVIRRFGPAPRHVCSLVRPRP
jgi:GT2 family glycosyltransferase